MRSPYGDDGRVRGSLAYPHRDSGYSADPVGETVCNRLALVAAAQQWAALLAQVDHEPVAPMLTPSQLRGRNARRQEARRLRSLTASANAKEAT